MVWRGVALFVFVVGVFTGATAIADPHPFGSRFEVALFTGWVACLVIALYAVAALCWRWHLVRDDASGWLAAAGVAAGTFLVTGPLRLGAATAGGADWAGEVDVLVVAALVLLLGRAEHVVPLPRIGPVGVGLAVGVPALLLAVVARTVPPPGATEATVRGVVAVLVVAVGSLGVRVLMRLPLLPERSRSVLAWGCGFASVSRACAPPVLSQAGGPAVVSLLLALVAVALVGYGATGLLVRARVRPVPAAQAIARVARDDVLLGPAAAPSPRPDESERLHELRASFTGLALAIRLLAHRSDLPEERRAELLAMLESEADRLERLLHGAPSESDDDVDTDEVLAGVVASRRLVGQSIEWEPSGCWVEGSRDLLAAAVSVLLVNASVHAPGSTARLTVHEEDGRVRIRVADDGPGVPEALRTSLFARGVTSAATSGHGLGLHFARRVVGAQGGTLDLADPDPDTGATFELTLPASRRER